MPEQLDDRREAILSQLRHLVDEAQMLRIVLPRVPEALQAARPRDDARSLKETLAHIAHLDAHVRLPVVRGEKARQTDSAPTADTPTPLLLDKLVEARTALVEAAEARPESDWNAPAGGAPTLTHFLFTAVQEDAQALRALTLNLYDAQGLGA